MSRSLPGGPEAPSLRPGSFEGISDERLTAELRAAGLLVTGSGGIGVGGPDHSGGGGGDGDDWDDDGEWPRRHYPRAVRVIALATATLLALGTAGAWASLIVDASHPAFPSQVVVVSGAAATHDSVAAVTAGATATPPRTTWHLSVTVANRSGATAIPECEVFVDAGGHIVDGWVVFHRIADGASENRLVSVAVPGAARTLPDVGTACGAR